MRTGRDDGWQHLRGECVRLKCAGLVLVRSRLRAAHSAFAYNLPMRAWRLLLIVGAVMGAILLRIGSSDSRQAASTSM